MTVEEKKQQEEHQPLIIGSSRARQSPFLLNYSPYRTSDGPVRPALLGLGSAGLLRASRSKGRGRDGRTINGSTSREFTSPFSREHIIQGRFVECVSGPETKYSGGHQKSRKFLEKIFLQKQRYRGGSKTHRPSDTARKDNQGLAGQLKTRTETKSSYKEP